MDEEAETKREKNENEKQKKRQGIESVSGGAE
jgi:hypothetical protein